MRKSTAPGIIGELLTEIGIDALAKLCGVTAPTIYSWARNARRVSGLGAAKIQSACEANGIKPMVYVLSPNLRSGHGPNWFAASLPEGWVEWASYPGGFERRQRLETQLVWLELAAEEDLAAAKASGWPY